MLPEGWSRTTVGNACAIKNNLRLPINTEQRSSMPGPYPYFGPTGVLAHIDHYRIDEEFAVIGEDGDHFLKFREKPMTLHFQGKANVNNHAHVIGDSDACSPKWFYYWFMHRDLTAVLSRQGVGRYKLTKKGLGELEIWLPPKREQLQIARILSTSDQAIATTERLLANSSKQKLALIESLVCARTSPHIGEGIWTQSALKQVASIAVSSVDKKSENGERAVQLCNYTDVYYSDCIDSRLGFMQATASGSEIDKFSLRLGDVIITKDSETASDIAVAARVTEDVPNLVCGYHLAIVRPDSSRIDAVFLHSYFSLSRTKDYFASNANGVTRFGLPLSAIQHAPIAFPSLSEQRKIAQIISNAELEIEAMARDLKLLKIQKQALQAQLLTGKRRVRLDAAETGAA